MFVMLNNSIHKLVDLDHLDQHFCLQAMIKTMDSNFTQQILVEIMQDGRLQPLGLIMLQQTHS